MQNHAIPVTIYYRVAALLFLLMIATVVAGRNDLGHWNTPIALAIAVTKAALIVIFFMHVGYGTPLLKLFASGGFLWLAIMLTITMADYLTRGETLTPRENRAPLVQADHAE